MSSIQFLDKKKPLIENIFSKKYFLPFLLFCCSCNADTGIIAVSDPSSGTIISHNDTVIVEAATNDKEPLLISYKASNASNVSVTITNEQNNINFDARWLIDWYQGASAGQNIKQKAGAKIIKELLVKNPSIIKKDEHKPINYIQVNADYKDISKIPIFKSTRSISVKDYPIRDNKELLPYTVDKDQVIDLYVLMNAKPNIQNESGSVVIRFFENDIEKDAVNINFKTLPFQLEKSNISHALYYRGRLDLKNSETISSDWKTKVQLLTEFNNLRDHGIDQITTYQDANNKSLFSTFNELKAYAGLDTHEIFYLGKTIQPDINTKEIPKYQKNYNAAKEYAMGAKLFLYGVDEAKGNAISKQIPFWQTFKNQGFYLMAAGRKEDAERLAGNADIFIAAYEPKSVTSHLIHQNHGRIYAYANPQVGVEDPIIYRKNYGFPLWQNNYDGAMTYAYQHTAGNNIWDDFDSKDYRDHVFAYPTADGVIDTLAWEGYREAVDDLRYLATFISLLEKNKNKLPPALYAEYNTWLIQLKISKNIDPEPTRKLLIEKSKHILEAINGR